MVSNDINSNSSDYGINERFERLTHGELKKILEIEKFAREARNSKRNSNIVEEVDVENIGIGYSMTHEEHMQNSLPDVSQNDIGCIVLEK